MDFMFNNPEEEGYTIVITAKHVTGNTLDGYDCPGARAFKDALPSEVYLNLPKYGGLWGTRDNDDKQWTSYKKNSNGKLVSFNMMEAEIGDKIIFIFKKYFN